MPRKYDVKITSQSQAGLPRDHPPGGSATRMPGRIIYYDVDGRRIRRFDESAACHLGDMQMRSTVWYVVRLFARVRLLTFCWRTNRFIWQPMNAVTIYNRIDRRGVRIPSFRSTGYRQLMLSSYLLFSLTLYNFSRAQFKQMKAETSTIAL